MTIEQILKMRQEAKGLNKLMHMHVITLDKDGGATVELDLTEELLNPLGLAHGGTIFTLCDIAAVRLPPRTVWWLSRWIPTSTITVPAGWATS